MILTFRAVHKRCWQRLAKRYSSSSQEMDQLGAWDTRINFPLSEEQSIRRGTLIPVLSTAQVGVYSDVGRRFYQEDRFTVCEPLPDTLALAVWDGHGGDSCANFCSAPFERFLVHRLKRSNNGHKNEEDLEEILHLTLTDLDAAFCRHWKPKMKEGGTSPGSTATVALIRGGYELVVGQIGMPKKFN